MKKLALLLFMLGLAGSFSGCATAQLNSSVAPGADLKSVKKVYVVHLAQDSRGIDRQIAERLNLMGRTATFGERAAAPADVDAIITYQDKWMWDITMYMIELNVQLRQPKTEVALVTGHSLRTSLVRKSPSEMINEVLTDMFKKG